MYSGKNKGMIPEKKEFNNDKVNQKAKPKKTSLHPRNKHKGKYNFEELIAGLPELEQFVSLSEYGTETIDFFNSEAVKVLNKALLKQFYDIDIWDIPKGYLCPPVPGRADYIHHVADLIRNHNFGNIPRGSNIRLLDIGMGSSAIFSIISTSEYGWSCVGTDIDQNAIDSAEKTVEENKSLADKLSFRLQDESKNTFRGMIKLDEKYDVTVCNPPFHASANEAEKGTLRKLRNLKKDKSTKLVKNFEGVNNELWCDGGELRFIQDMINQSKEFSSQVFWFTTLVSKHSNLRAIHKLLREAKVVKVETILMGQGNKSSRIVAWTFLDKRKQLEWKGDRWGVEV